MPKELIKLPDASKHRLWAELGGDSAIESLCIAALGWVPRKQERVVGPTPRYAFCLLARGKGSFLDFGSDAPRPINGPGIFFTSYEMRHDYGPDCSNDGWEEYYWIIEGARVAEWQAAGWWPRQARFRSVNGATVRELITLFKATTVALEQRDRPALDAAKLSFERWLCANAEPIISSHPSPPSPLIGIVEKWRREPQRAWSLREGAAQAGVSYTRFRASFVEEYGTSPYDYLVRLRLELATGWLRGTDEPVKSIASHCGFNSVEPFVRAFGRVYGTSPARWRRERHHY
ncbi:MAG TPA: AraC family transcriptional regulator [Chthoniobacterales bacterium]|jgi:AraC-like DNA-binding protein